MPRSPLMLRQLDREWAHLATTSRMSTYLRTLRRADPVNWRFHTADDLVDAARYEHPDTPSVLARIITDGSGDDLAFRIAVQVMLPRWWTIAVSLSGIPIDDAVALVVEVGTTHLRRYDPATAGTPIGFRLWANTRRECIRRVVGLRERRSRQTTLDAIEEVGVEDVYGQSTNQLRASLVEAGVDANIADLMVATRVEGQRLTDRAREQRSSAATLRQRRFRAERRLKFSLTAA